METAKRSPAAETCSCAIGSGASSGTTPDAPPRAKAQAGANNNPAIPRNKVRREATIAT